MRVRGCLWCGVLSDSGVEGKVVIPFSKFPDGVWFIEGLNGAGLFLSVPFLSFLAVGLSVACRFTGKSTILEAITWCQFNKFLRSEMLADYAVNDKVRYTAVRLHHM